MNIATDTLILVMVAFFFEVLWPGLGELSADGLAPNFEYPGQRGFRFGAPTHRSPYRLGWLEKISAARLHREPERRRNNRGLSSIADRE
jgi:hypothetical protein